jgi:hypothetical protein
MKFDTKYFSWDNYFQEVLESFITLVVFNVFIIYIHKKKNTSEFFKSIPIIILISFFTGFITMIIECLSPDLKTNIKQGISFSTGVAIINGAV